jgi:hypothetical protein
MSSCLELHTRSEPHRSVAGIWIEEAARRRGTGNDAKVVIRARVAQPAASRNRTRSCCTGRTRSVRVAEMRSVGQAERIGSHLQHDFLLYLELTQHAQFMLKYPGPRNSSRLVFP